ncbi:WAT1-related protein At1g43650-like [Henckelia pumila]|uniref:WAT1-related protein At1g43650-like n=1 Tax=Henckelia pumila TaxID=405737 RepID=UPI003C6DFA0D
MLLRKQKPYLAVMFIQLSFAGMFLLSKVTISGSGMKSPIFVAYRQAFAAVALAPFAFICTKTSATTPPLSCLAYFKLFVISSYGITLTLNLSFAGLKYTSATFATAILNIVPVFVFVMSVISRVEKLDIREWHGMAKVLGTMFGFLGAMVFTFYKGPSLFSSSNSEISHPDLIKSSNGSNKDWIKGSSLMLAGQFTWSMWLTMQGPLLKQYPGKLRLTFLQIGFSCISAMIYGASMTRDISWWKLGWNVSLLTVVYCGIIVNALVYWLQAWVVEKKGAVFSANFGPFATIFAAIVSAIFLKETLYMGCVIGGLLLVVGLYSFLWGRRKEAQQNLDPSNGEAHLEGIITSTNGMERDEK